MYNTQDNHTPTDEFQRQKFLNIRESANGERRVWGKNSTRYFRAHHFSSCLLPLFREKQILQEMFFSRLCFIMMRVIHTVRRKMRLFLRTSIYRAAVASAREESYVDARHELWMWKCGELKIYLLPILLRVTFYFFTAFVPIPPVYHMYYHWDSELRRASGK